MTLLSCPRCGADASPDSACSRCGRPTSSDEARRQEVFLTYVLKQLEEASDLRAALLAARERSETALAEPMPEAPPAEQSTEQPTEPPTEPVAKPTSPPPRPKSRVQGVRALDDDDVVQAPSPRPPPLSGPQRPLPPPRPTLSPAEAKAVFERRLEIGGWFTGALFAVGGSLWATNLFWNDIPQALRPVVVGGGLALFAAAFMAMGAMLAARHKESLAGHVLGVVGRLIAVSATIPLSQFRHDNLPLALITDVVMLVGLWASLRFAHKKGGGDDKDSDAKAFIIGIALALIGPSEPAFCVVVIIAALAWARFCIGERTIAATSNARVWVADISGLAACFTAVFATISSTAMRGSAKDGLFAVSLLACVELVTRLVAQRPTLFAWRGVTSWVCMLWAVGTVLALTGNVDTAGPLPVVVAFGFMGASFYDPSRLGLPRAFSLFGVLAWSSAAYFLSDSALSMLNADTRHDLARAVAMAVAFLLSKEHRMTTTPTLFGQGLSVCFWIGAWAVSGFGFDRISGLPAMAIALALMFVDKRLLRSVPYGLCALFMSLPFVGAVASHIVEKPNVAIFVAVYGSVALAVAWQRRRLRAFTTSTSAWLFVFVVVRAVVISESPRTTITIATVLMVAFTAALAMMVRTRGRTALALSAFVVMCADLFQHTAPSLFLTAGLGATVGAFIVSVAVIAARVRATRTTSKKRRSERIAERNLWHIVGVVAALYAFALLALSAGDVSAVGLMRASLACAVLSLLTALLFMGRGTDLLVSASILSATASTSWACLAHFFHDDEPGTLATALMTVAIATAALITARLLYRRRAVPMLLDAWPKPSSLRWPAIAVLLSASFVVACVGQFLNSSLGEATARRVMFAQRYGPGVVLIACALVVAGYVLLRTRRTYGAAFVGLSVIGMAVIGADGIAHAAHWIPPSTGLNQALASVVLVVFVAMLERAGGRRVLVRLGLSWRTSLRVRLAELMLSCVPLLVCIAGAFAMREAPHVIPWPYLIGGAALVVSLWARASALSARLAGVGALVFGAGVGVVIAEYVVHAASLRTAGLTFILSGAVVAMAVAQRVWAKADGHTALARRTAEAFVVPFVLLLSITTVVDSHPDAAVLMATYIAAGCVVFMTTRMALEREQTWPALLSQGVALAIYVDLRRRAGVGGDTEGLDAIMCLVATAAFIVIRRVMKKRERGTGVAQAAELYAATLPVIATVLSSGHGSRALVLIVAGGMYALLSKDTRGARYELLAGAALVVATMSCLWWQGVSQVSLYLFPIAVAGTFLARRHRGTLGPSARVWAVMSQAPLYCVAAYSALESETLEAFALGVVFVTVGVFYSIRVKDRRSLYASVSAAVVLVVGRLVLLGLDNAVFGTLLLASAGILVLAVMTVFTIKRDTAKAALDSAKLDDWDSDDDDD